MISLMEIGLNQRIYDVEIFRNDRKMMKTISRMKDISA